MMPTISGRLHIGILIAVVLWPSYSGGCCVTTTFGFRLRTIGDSPRAACDAGISVPLATLAVLSISGALAGRRRSDRGVRRRRIDSIRRRWRSSSATPAS